MEKVFEEKTGSSFNRFERFVKEIINVPRKEIDGWELSISGQKKTGKKRH